MVMMVDDNDGDDDDNNDDYNELTLVYLLSGSVKNSTLGQKDLMIKHVTMIINADKNGVGDGKKITMMMIVITLMMTCSWCNCPLTNTTKHVTGDGLVNIIIWCHDNHYHNQIIIVLYAGHPYF